MTSSFFNRYTLNVAGAVAVLSPDLKVGTYMPPRSLKIDKFVFESERKLGFGSDNGLNPITSYRDRRYVGF